MSIEEAESALGALWDAPEGLLWKLRQGAWDKEGAEQFKDTLRRIDPLPEGVSKTIVALLWFIPTFMLWQRERVVELGGDAASLDVLDTWTVERLMEILGMP